MRSWSGFTCAITISFSSAGAIAQNCEAILKYGIYDSVIYRDSQSSRSQFKNWWCDNQTRSTGSEKRSTWALDATYNASSGAFRHSKSNVDYDEFSRNACSSTSRDDQFQRDVQLFEERASKVIADAWAQCTTRGTSVAGLRGWIDYPGGMNSKIFTANFGFQSPGANLHKATVRIRNLNNLSCDQWKTQSRITVSHPQIKADVCRLVDPSKEAYIRFDVDENVATNPPGWLHIIPKDEKIPPPNGIELYLADAVCVDPKDSIIWSKYPDLSTISAKAGEESAGTTSKMRCTWSLPTNVWATKAILKVEKLNWSSGRRSHDGTGGDRSIVILDQASRRAGSETWDKGAKDPPTHSSSNELIVAEFKEPTSVIAVEFVARDSWEAYPLRWQVKNFVLEISAGDIVRPTAMLR